MDWGLGHTTRCIPIIRRLLDAKHEVVFAGNDSQQTFIAGLFPELKRLHLPGYCVRYGPGPLMLRLLAQVPRLVRRVREEHRWLLELVRSERIDGIISDNRYGLWHPEVPSVILTHQAEIRTGLGRLADRLLRRIHYRFLRRFGACWIVDVAGADGLGGSLSHPEQWPPGARYIGWLSGLSAPPAQVREQHLLVLLSGPEPQRSLLSGLLWTQSAALNMPIVFVEGSAEAVRNDAPPHILHYPRVSGPVLQSLLEAASMVVCRSGYSTLMDLLLLRKKAILIPTPGQTEQEYLASRNLFYAAPQKGFSLRRALAAAGKFRYRLPDKPGSHQLFSRVLDEWVETL